MTPLALTSAALACVALWHCLPRRRTALRGALLLALALLVQQPGIGGYLQAALALGFPFLLLTFAARRLPARVVALPLLCGIALAITCLVSSSPALSLIKGLAWASLLLLVALSLSERANSAGDWALGAKSTEAAARLLGAGIPFLLVVGLAVSLALGGGFLIPETTRIPQLTPTLLDMHPNTFAFFLAIGIMALIWSPGTAWRLRDVLGVLALATLVLMTRSRTALLLLAVGLLVLMFTRGGKRARWAGALIVTGIAFSVALDVVPLEFLMRGQAESDVSQLSGRLPLWDAALAGVRERPWLGWGYGVGPELAIERHATTYLAYSVSTSDNMYLDVLLSGGLIVLALWLVLIVVLVARTVGASRRVPNWTGLLAACACILLARTFSGSGFDVLGPIALAFHLIWVGISAAAMDEKETA